MVTLSLLFLQVKAKSCRRFWQILNDSNDFQKSTDDESSLTDSRWRFRLGPEGDWVKIACVQMMSDFTTSRFGDERF